MARPNGLRYAVMRGVFATEGGRTVIARHDEREVGPACDNIYVATKQ